MVAPAFPCSRSSACGGRAAPLARTSAPCASGRTCGRATCSCNGPPKATEARGEGGRRGRPSPARARRARCRRQRARGGGAGGLRYAGVPAPVLRPHRPPGGRDHLDARRAGGRPLGAGCHGGGPPRRVLDVLLGPERAPVGHLLPPAAEDRPDDPTRPPAASARDVAPPAATTCRPSMRRTSAGVGAVAREGGAPRRDRAKPV